MNITVSNKNKTLINELNVDIIKSIEGTYTIEELKNMFYGMVYNKLIIDITSIKDYEDINTLKNISLNFDVNKVIILLNDEEKLNESYISKMITFGIYNFTKNLDGLIHLINNTNSYANVAQFHNPDIENNVSFGINEDITTNDNNEELKNSEIPSSGNTKILGVKNITEHAGASSLIYMMKEILKTSFNVIGVEIDKLDFTTFKDNEMLTTDSKDITRFLTDHAEKDIILIDLNDYDNEDMCDEVIYLIEPSITKLKRLMLKDKYIFDKLKNKKIILNQSMINNKEVKEFEFEAKTKIFYNMPPQNDRDLKNSDIKELLKKLKITQ